MRPTEENKHTLTGSKTVQNLIKVASGRFFDSSGCASCGRSGCDTELLRPPATASHDPRSQVMLLADTLGELARHVVEATRSGNGDVVQHAWLAFLA